MPQTNGKICRQQQWLKQASSHWRELTKSKPSTYISAESNYSNQASLVDLTKNSPYVIVLTRKIQSDWFRIVHRKLSTGARVSGAVWGIEHLNPLCDNQMNDSSHNANCPFKSATKLLFWRSPWPWCQIWEDCNQFDKVVRTSKGQAGSKMTRDHKQNLSVNQKMSHLPPPLSSLKAALLYKTLTR